MPQPIANAAVQFDVLLSDARVLVVNKPPGVVTEPGLGHRDDSLMNGLFSKWSAHLGALGEKRDYGLLHRLDRDTSGAVMVALDADAYDRLRSQFEQRSIRKQYLALVEGKPPHDRGSITLPLAEVRRGDMKISVIDHGTRRGRDTSARSTAAPSEPAITHYRILGRGNGRSLLQVELVTGRLHQIRAHMAELGCPVVNDRVYRVDLPPNTSAPPKGRSQPPVALHAWTLAFAHPEGNAVQVTAPPSATFISLLAQFQIAVPSAPAP
jgi:23S rRNA pseudouridine1911/1915/1917 synthase